MSFGSSGKMHGIPGEFAEFSENTLFSLITQIQFGNLKSKALTCLENFPKYKHNAKNIMANKKFFFESFLYGFLRRVVLFK